MNMRVTKLSTIMLTICLAAATQLFGADVLWKGSSNPYWNSAANWVGGVVPGIDDVAVFDPDQQVIAPWNFFHLNANATVAGLRFTNLTQSVSCGSTGDFVLSIGTNGVSVAGRDVTLGMACELSADQRWTVAAGVELRHSGELRGSAKLTKSGAGRAWLSGTSTFTGEYRVEAGTLKGVGGSAAPVRDGLEVWMDAAAMETIVTNASGAVTSWTDRAGGESMTPVGSGGGPRYGATFFNGWPGLRFDKTSNNGLQMEAGYANTTNAATAFVMIQRRSAQVTNAGLLSLYKNGNNDFDNNGGAAFYHFVGASFYSIKGNRNRTGGQINISYETPICLMSRFNGASHTLVQDGEIAGSVDTSTPMLSTFNADRLLLGNRPVDNYIYPFNGDVAEVLIYNRVLTAAEEQQVTDYLIAKWKPMESAAELLHDAALWFDASVPASITTNASGAVTAWASLVSEAKLIPYEAKNYPTLVAQSANGLPAIRFDKSMPNNLQCNNAGYYNRSSALTFFVSFIPEKDQVANAGVASVFGATLRDYNEIKNAVLMYLPSVTRGQEWSGHRNSSQLSRSYATPGVPAVAMSSYDGTEHTFAVNGDAVGAAVPSQGAFDAYTFRLGERHATGRLPFNGDIQEVLVYNRRLSAHEQSLVIGYLENKWVAVTNLSTILAAADVHLDANEPTSLMTDTTGNVTNWVSLVDGAVMNVPTNGYAGPLLVADEMNHKPVLRFSSGLKTALFMEHGYSNTEAQVNAFIVMQRGTSQTDYSGVLSIYDRDTINDNQPNYSAIMAFYRFADTIAGFRANSLTATAPNIPYNVPHCLHSAFNGTAHTMSLNGTQLSSVASTGLFNANRLCLGSRYEYSVFQKHFSGDIAEVLIYNRALSPVEKNIITAHLQEKWMPASTSANTLDALRQSAVLWLDAAAAGTLITDSNGQVTAWSNRVNNIATALAPPTGLKGPTVLADGMNGRPVLRFDKDASVKQALMIDTGFAITSTASTAVIMLKTRPTQDAYARLANIWKDNGDDNNSVDGGIYGYFTSSTVCQGFRSDNTKSVLSPLPVETPVCLFSRFDGSYHRMIKDELLCDRVASTGVFNANRFALSYRAAKPQHFNGDIAEVLIFNYALAPDQQKILYNYLQSKWVTPASTAAMGGVQMIEVNSGAQLDVRDLNGLTLAESGKLSGAGAVLGDLTVAQGGTVEAISEGSDHTLAVTGDLSFESGAMLAVDYLNGAPLITADGMLTLPSGITFAVTNLKESGRGGKLPVLRGGSWDNGTGGAPSTATWTLENAGSFSSLLLDASDFSVNLQVIRGTLLMIQ